MNRELLLWCAATLCALTAAAQDRADRQELTDPDSFTMIVLGDPQGYTKHDINQPLFGISALTKHLAHRTGACDRFDMVIE